MIYRFAYFLCLAFAINVSLSEIDNVAGVGFEGTPSYLAEQLGALFWFAYFFEPWSIPLSYLFFELWRSQVALVLVLSICTAVFYTWLFGFLFRWQRFARMKFLASKWNITLITIVILVPYFVGLACAIHTKMTFVKAPNPT